jgi:hypothetical protein
MEYAIQLFLPVIGGLLLGNWLTKTYGLSPIWTVLLGILGLAGGIGIMYKRFLLQQNLPHFTPKPRQKPKPSQSLQALDSLYKKLDEEPPDENDGFETDDDDPKK